MFEPIPAISVIIPLFNEEESLPLLYRDLSKVMEELQKSYELVFVDDGSVDESFQILKEIADQDTHVKTVRLRRNFGQTAALAAGFDHARGDVMVPMDGDLQNDPADIPALLE